MIALQAIGMAEPVITLDYLPEYIKKFETVFIIAINVLARMCWRALPRAVT